MGHRDGVALIAEGVGERLDPEALRDIPGTEVAYDPHGNIELREIPLGHVLKRRVESRLADRGDKATIVDINLGYELRCAAPIPFDCEYGRDLGWGAVHYLLSEDYRGGAMVCLDGGRVRPVPFQDLMDPNTGRTRIRLVDIDTETYKVAHEYMIRLKQADLEDPEQVDRLAKAAGLSPEQFRERFGRVICTSQI